jgi:germination protein M
MIEHARHQKNKGTGAFECLGAVFRRREDCGRRVSPAGTRRASGVDMQRIASYILSIIIVALVAALAVAACGGSDETPSPSPTDTQSASPSESPSPSPSVTPPSPSQTGSLTVLSVYFMRDQYVGAAHRAVPATAAPARAAMVALLAGPTVAELAAGLHTRIPPGTEMRGLTIRDGVATVDLGGTFAAGGDPLEERGRLAQVVYTLTQFATVDGVRFRIDGQPLVFRGGEGAVQRGPQTRDSFEDVTPAIFVEIPAVGDHVGSPLVIQGTANTFEAQFVARILGEDGQTLGEQSVMATSGSGTRGTFNEAISFTADASRVTLVVFEPSAADGRPIHVVRIPLSLEGTVP